jgi:hypothetical protein
MSMQFTWCASDSILAAPLVIDLARFAALGTAGAVQAPMIHHPAQLQFHYTDDPAGAKQMKRRLELSITKGGLQITYNTQEVYKIKEWKRLEDKRKDRQYIRVVMETWTTKKRCKEGERRKEERYTAKKDRHTVV